MDELKNAVKDRVVENLDEIIQRTDSPFTTEVLNRHLPPKFHLPQLEPFDGSRYPLDHIESFKTLILLQMTLGEVMCKAFLITLNGIAQLWFGKLPLGTIANFEQLSKGFVYHCIRGQQHKKPIGHLLNVRQVEGESLRQYVTRFNKELVQVDEAKDQVILMTFQAGLLLGDFFFSITKSLPKMVAKLLHKVQKYINANDTVTTKGVMTKRKWDEGTSHKPNRKKEAWSTGHATDKKRNLLHQRPKLTNFTPLVMPIKQVLI